MCVTCRSSRVSNKIESKSNCKYLYTELVSLDLKVLDIYKLNKDSNLLGLNKTLRTWINNLRNECPPSEDLTTIREYIDNEHTKYFSD